MGFILHGFLSCPSQQPEKGRCSGTPKSGRIRTRVSQAAKLRCSSTCQLAFHSDLVSNSYSLSPVLRSPESAPVGHGEGNPAAQDLPASK